ncbi:CPBP family intramembrane glutamic endopeptidase [Galbibacter sp.]|uniref:CPBP family intramembrane glutamic endopeptidase n=1 Tax=Galbibacter sp. TaxID=2918471 RepID=UPI003A9593A7
MLGIIIILITSWLLLYYIERENLRVLGFCPVNNRIFQFAIGVGFIFVLKLLFILIDTQMLSISWTKSPTFNLNSFFLSGWYHLKAALTEDLIFRGALLYILIKKIGLQKGLLISAFAFGIYHWFSYGIINSDKIILLIYVLATTGFTGYVWGYTFAKTKSIMMPLGFHFGWNFIITLFYDAQPYEHLIVKETAKIELSAPYNTYYSLFIGLTPALVTLIFVKNIIKK